MVTKVDTAIKMCTDLCSKYSVDRNWITDEIADFTLRFEIERVPGVTVPVIFEHLDKSDLVNNGFEVPQ